MGQAASCCKISARDATARDGICAPKHRLITTLAASAQHRLEYALEGSIFIGGAVVQWLRDN